MVAVLISSFPIGNTFSFGGKPCEKGIDFGGTELQLVPQFMKTYEIADPVPVELFCADAVVMQAHHSLGLFTQAGFGGAFHDCPSTVSLYSGNGRVKRGGQANTINYQRNTGNVLFNLIFSVATIKAKRSYTEGSVNGLVPPSI